MKEGLKQAPYHKVKILSTDVGLAPEVLHEDCICKNAEDFIQRFNRVDRVQENYDNVCANYLPKTVIKNLDDFLET